METWVVVLVIVAAVALVAIAAWVAMRQRKRQELQRSFGPEYERAVERSEDTREAERELEARRERRAELDIRPLPPDARQRYAESWRLVQERFVDHPVQSVRDADRLLQQVMADRGYPVDDFDRRADDISVDHPDLVENYRNAHAASRSADGGEASTEDLRKAMIHYRALFGELLGTAATSDR